MEIIQKLTLDESERQALGKAIGIIDKLSDVTHRSMADIFDVLLNDYATIDKPYEYILPEEMDLGNF